jgi:translation initiation factor 5
VLTTDPTKFFGCELGAQTSMADDRYIVNGAHTQERLLELLDSFIVKYVLCGACDNPETEFVFSGKGRNEVIHKDCKACGRQTNIDMRHKLTTYILKNPPPKKGKGGKGMTAQANAGGPMVYDAEEGDGSPEAPDMGVPTSGTDIDAALGRMGDPILDQPDAVEELSKKLESAQVDDDDEDGGDSPYAVLGAWLEEHKDATNDEINAQIQELGLTGKHKALLEIGEHLFTPENVGPEMEKRVSLLEPVSTPSSFMTYTNSQLCTGEKHKKSLLGGIERLLGNCSNSEEVLAAGATSKALMVLYQADIIDEELAIQWGTHVSKKYVEKDVSKKVRKSAEAFVAVCPIPYLT